MQQRTIRTLSIALFGALLLWGIFSTLVYLGVPVHGAVLVPDDVLQSLQGVCDPGGFLCRGVYTLIPMILHTLGRASPFLPYAILWLLIGGVIVAKTAMKDGLIRLRCMLSPLRVLLLFVLSIWMLFTVLSYGQVGDAPLRRVVEPLPEVYANVKGEGLEELQKNFARLEDKGCLRQVGTFTNGAKVYSMTTFCMQRFFVSRVFTQLLWALFILAELMILGHAVLQFFRIKPEPLAEAVLSAGLGAGFWIALLWSLAVFHFFVSGVVWILLLAVPVIGYKSVLHWYRALFQKKWTVDLPLWSPAILLAWLLLSYFALNFLTVIRPFPIGWDDLGSYLNRPNLLVSYGHFIHSMAPFQWEYLTAVGFSLFGFGSAVGATASMVINWLEGVIAVFAVFAFGRTYFGHRGGLLSALLYYSLPLVGHFSYADMKIDNAVFAMGALATLSLFLGILPPVTEEGTSENRPLPDQMRWLALAGALAGFAFGMKVTAIMVVMAMLVILGGVLLHWTAAVGAGALVVVVLAANGGIDLASVGQRIFGEGTEIATKGVLIAFVIVGITLVATAFIIARNRSRQAILSGLVFVAGFAVVILPWIEHNSLQQGYIFPHVAFGVPDKMTVRLDIKGSGVTSAYGEPVRTIPPELKIDPKHPACVSTGHKEEIDRYWGFRIGWDHYLTLPWRTVLNLDSAGYYVTTMPALFLFPLLLLLPHFWTRKGKWLRWMTLGTFIILLEWMFTASGIPWYGIGVFLGLVLGIEAFVMRAPDTFSRSLAGGLITIALCGNFAQRLWQFEQQRNLFEYPIGRASAEVMRERTIPHYDDIAEIAVELHRTRPDRPYLYRVGTFIPYFIPRNLEVIGIVDHQLDVFNCLYQERDSELTVKRLKALGFSSIVFDTNTATIERESNGTLHKKVQSFVDFLNDPKAGLQVVINDNDGGVAYILIP